MKSSDSRRIYVQRIDRVMDFISEHLDEPLPLERLARLAHFSPFHFHRLFRSLVDEPLHVFIRRLRLESAVRAMKYGPRATLTEIALRSSFASSSDFSRAFKQAYGFSPSQFTPETFIEKSKIRQDLLANAGYGSALDRAWNYLFRAWLPASGYEPTNEPAMEVYRGHPLKIGWEVFDIDCLVPVKPLEALGSSRTHAGRK